MPHVASHVKSEHVLFYGFGRVPLLPLHAVGHLESAAKAKRGGPIMGGSITPTSPQSVADRLASSVSGSASPSTIRAQALGLPSSPLGSVDAAAGSAPSSSSTAPADAPRWGASGGGVGEAFGRPWALGLPATSPGCGDALCAFGGPAQLLLRVGPRVRETGPEGGAANTNTRRVRRWSHEAVSQAVVANAACGKHGDRAHPTVQAEANVARFAETWGRRHHRPETLAQDTAHVLSSLRRSFSRTRCDADAA